MHKEDTNDKDFLDLELNLNLHSSNIDKGRVEENNFWEDADNLSSIERELENEENEEKEDKVDKEDKGSKIVNASAEGNDKNEEIKITKNS